jgi:hypothetical protein
MDGWESQEEMVEEGQSGRRRKVHVGVEVAEADESAQRIVRSRVGELKGAWAYEKPVHREEKASWEAPNKASRGCGVK